MKSKANRQAGVRHPHISTSDKKYISYSAPLMFQAGDDPEKTAPRRRQGALRPGVRSRSPPLSPRRLHAAAPGRFHPLPCRMRLRGRGLPPGRPVDRERLQAMPSFRRRELSTRLGWSAGRRQGEAGAAAAVAHGAGAALSSAARHPSRRRSPGSRRDHARRRRARAHLLASLNFLNIVNFRGRPRRKRMACVNL
ncbi:MAG: hypothetical protein QOH47_2624 [Sphingomonadales bacterium]|nr:hypothetical protein [Sphingomonadales bacterium]